MCKFGTALGTHPSASVYLVGKFGEPKFCLWTSASNSGNPKGDKEEFGKTKVQKLGKAVGFHPSLPLFVSPI